MDKTEEESSLVVKRGSFDSGHGEELEDMDSMPILYGLTD